MGKAVYICPSCAKEFLRYPSTVRKGVVPVCSKKCHGKSLSVKLLGSNNPNFGIKWNTEQRENLSKKVKQHFENPEARIIAGNSNRGQKFSPERIKKMHENRTPDSYSHAPTEERKIQIGIQSSKNWQNEEFKEKVISKSRKTKEEKGIIVPRSQLSEWEIYWRKASWKPNYDYAPGIKLGTNRLCRDHLVSRKQGFEKGIFPKILSHPANCEIVSWEENGRRARIKPYEHSPEKLFEKILNYSGNYPDHHRTVDLVNRYLKGENCLKEGLHE